MARMAGPYFIEWPLDEEVVRFVTEPLNYSARTMTGMELRILKAQTFQPPVENPDNFPTFMWIETAEGFFLLRQHLVFNQGLPWRILRRILPAPGQPYFFHDFQDVLESYVAEQGLVVPFDLDEDVPGFTRFRSP